MDENPRIAELRKKLEKDPGSRLFAQLAEELRKEGKHEDAIGVARRGLEKNPNYPSARLTLARALLDSGRPQEARQELDQIVKASPDNILASRLLGDALEDLGEVPLAIQQFERTLRLSPDDKALTEKIAELTAKKLPTPGVLSPSVSAPVAASAPLPSVLPEISMPSVFPDVPLPSVFEPPPIAASATLPSVPHEIPMPAVFPDAPLPSVFDLPPVAPMTSLALDRDLASGTFSPGSLHVSDLKFEDSAPSLSPAEPALATPSIDETLGFGNRVPAFEPPVATASGPGREAANATVLSLPLEPPTPPVAPLALTAKPSPSFGAASIPVHQELPSVEMPPEEPDLGAQTLPLTSLTLADLYLQQGLKAEASAVLSQVLKEEPENARAQSKFAAVSDELAQLRPAVPEQNAEVEVPPPAAAAPAQPSATPWPPRAIAPSVVGPSGDPSNRPQTRAEMAKRSVHSLKAFLGAVEREAIQQRASELEPIGATRP